MSLPKNRTILLLSLSFSSLFSTSIRFFSILSFYLSFFHTLLSISNFLYLLSLSILNSLQPLSILFTGYSQIKHTSRTPLHSGDTFPLAWNCPIAWNALSPLRFLILSFILFNTCLYILPSLHVPSLPLKPSCITPYCSDMLHSSSTLRIYLYGTASHCIALHCIAFSHFIQPVSEQSVMAKKGRKQSILKSKEHDAKKEGGRH